MNYKGLKIISLNQNHKNHNFLRSMVKLLCFLSVILSSLVSARNNFEDRRQLLQLTEYIGVDYSAAVGEGKIIDQGEFQEMLEFSNIIAEKSVGLFSDKPLSDTSINNQQSFVTLSQFLLKAVQNKQATQTIQQFSTQLKTILLENSPQLSLPKSLMSAETVTSLFQNECSSCHGITGRGDGQLSKQLTPTPTNFTDHERALNRSVMGLYDVISEGLDGTAMPSFNQLSAKQRWSLAFYVGSLAFNKLQVLDKTDHLDSSIRLENIVMFSPNELLADGSKETPDNPNQTLNSIEKLRADPAVLFAHIISPLSNTRKQLEKALLAYHRNEFTNAKRLAVSAYLDGFELIENNLDSFDKPLRKSIEINLLTLRKLLNDQSNASQVEQSISEIYLLLDKADHLLSESFMSNATLLSASFIILLREGLEALLVVIALLTILIRSKKQDALKFVHIGWGAALIAGALTWVAAQYLVEISGASREIMEGAAAMAASMILFYVGFWMHSKSQANQWQLYIQKNIDQRITTGTLWGISGLAFIAVYREVFETVLFYQSLLTQTNASQGIVLASGFFAAVLVLSIIAWLIMKYSVKLPIGRFFSISTYVLLVLSFVLMGKAISALQEAAIIGISPMSVNFQIDWLGINSTWQGISGQLLIGLLSLGLMAKQWYDNQRDGSITDANIKEQTQTS